MLSKISGSLRKQGLGVSPIVQQNQEFSIQNEDFPALPGFKGAVYSCCLSYGVYSWIHSVLSSGGYQFYQVLSSLL